MLKLTKTGIGLLTRQYRSVLRKCWMINVGLFALGAAMMPNEAEADIDLSGILTRSYSSLWQNNTGTIYGNLTGQFELDYYLRGGYATVRTAASAADAYNAGAITAYYDGDAGVYKYYTFDDLSDSDKAFYNLLTSYGGEKTTFIHGDKIISLINGVNMERLTKDMGDNILYGGSGSGAWTTSGDGTYHLGTTASPNHAVVHGQIYGSRLVADSDKDSSQGYSEIQLVVDTANGKNGNIGIYDQTKNDKVFYVNQDGYMETKGEFQVVDTDNQYAANSAIFQVKPDASDGNSFVNVFNANFNVVFKNDISGNGKYGTQTYRYSNGNAAYFEVVNRKADNTRLDIHLGALLDNGNASVPYFYMEEGSNKGVIIRSDLGLFLGDNLSPGNTSASNVWNTSSSYLSKTGFKVNGSTAVSGIDTAVPTTSPAAGTEKLITSRAVYDRLSDIKFEKNSSGFYYIRTADSQALVDLQANRIVANSLSVLDNSLNDVFIAKGSGITIGGNISANGQTVTPTNLGYLSGVTSNIQTQLDNKVNNSTLNDYYTKLDFAEESVMNHSHRSFGASPNVKRSSALFTPRKREAGGSNTTAANTPALKNIIIGRSLDQTSRFGGMTLLLCAPHTTPLDAFAYGSARHDSIF